jgi:Protein of unknown function (DUF1565)
MVLAVVRERPGPPKYRPFLALVSFLSAIPPLGCEDFSGGTDPHKGIGDGGVTECPPGQISGRTDCLPVGLAGCDEIFADEDGLCRPAMTKCGQGTLPRFDAGCIPAGITGCAQDFLGEDGLCRPAMTKCGPNTFAVPKEGCVSIDGPSGCGAAPWGDIDERPEDVYVDPSYEGGDGLGTRARPLTTLAAALSRLHSGGRIILAEGDYDEAAEIAQPIQLIGRCASKVTLRGTQLDSSGNVTTVWVHDVIGAGVRGVRVRVGSAASIGLLVQAAEVDVRDVHITGVNGAGIAVTQPGARLTLTHGLIAADRSAQTGSERWTNLLLLEGASAGLTGSAIVNGSVNVRISSAVQETTVENSLIENGDALPVPSDQLGLFIDAGALRLSGSAVIGNRVGVAVTGSGASLRAEGNLITAPLDGLPQSHDVQASLGARVLLTSNLLAGACDAQLALQDEGTDVTATGNLLQGTSAPGQGTLGRGIDARGGTLKLSSNAIVQAYDAGLFASDAVVTAEGDVIVGTRASPLRPAEPAGLSLHGAQATLRSLYLASNEGLGVLYDEETRLELTESLIEGTSPRSDGALGVGLLGSEAASTLIRSSAVLDSHVAGLLLLSSPATLDGLLVLGVQSGTYASATTEGAQTTVAGLGDGLLAVDSTLGASQVHAEGCARAGLLFSNSGGTVAHTRSVRNLYGLVLQGVNAPALGEGNSFSGNTGTSQVEGGDLPTPQAAVTPR